jgi:serine-type D-Ala-D-Ala carboxypeptidase/endopeptidase
MFSRRSVICFAALAVSSLCVAGPQPSPLLPTEPSEAAIRQLLADRVNAIAGPDDGIGIVVGVVDAHGRKIVSYGHSGKGDRAALTGDTVFEIGSVGKIFTALLLSDMVRRHEVALADPVTKYLPPGDKLPQHDGRQITMVDLATHTSGLPFFPDTYPTLGDADTYTAKDLYDFLARYNLKREPGAEWEYSNIDYWLLGEALAHRAGVPVEELLTQRIFTPLKMSSTGAELTEQMRARLAQGYDAALDQAPPFYALSVYKTLGAAVGGVYSSANDLLNFVSVAVGVQASPLRPSMGAMTKTRRPIDGKQQALGWVAEHKGTDEFYLHDGGTWGYASAVALDPAKRTGVVVLSNQQNGVADIARHLLRPEIPLEPPSVARHREISMPAVALADYLGLYSAEDVGFFRITREGDHLVLTVPVDWGLPKFRLHPESNQSFFVAEMPMSVTFHRDQNRSITSALIYPPRGQRGISALKVAAQLH